MGCSPSSVELPSSRASTLSVGEAENSPIKRKLPERKLYQLKEVVENSRTSSLVRSGKNLKDIESPELDDSCDHLFTSVNSKPNGNSNYVTASLPMENSLNAQTGGGLIGTSRWTDNLLNAGQQRSQDKSEHQQKKGTINNTNQVTKSNKDKHDNEVNNKLRKTENPKVVMQVVRHNFNDDNY